MISMVPEYPRQQLLWPGAILGSIAHAVAVARYPDLAHEQSWDKNNYCVQDSSGSKGTVAFSGQRFIAVFFAESSERNPFTSDEKYDLQRFFAGLPDDLVTLAYEEALQYVLQDNEGIPSPIITSAFWGDGQQQHVAAAEAWADVFENGAFLIKNQLLTEDESLAAWQAEYELSDDEATFVTSLIHRKMSQPTSELNLTAADLSLLESIAKDDEGLETCRMSFAEINILL